MKKLYLNIAAALVFMLILTACDSKSPENSVNSENNTTSIRTETEELQLSNASATYTLPAPKTDGEISVESALENRRSRRNFNDTALSQENLSQILWSAYGITSERGLRTAPSAGALYPLEVYAVIGNVEGITPGVYRYITENHEIVRVIEGDVRAELAEASLGQSMVAEAPMSVFYSAVFERTTERYGERGVNYVYIEVGHSAQNVYLQAEALGLGTCATGAFTDDRVRDILNLPAEEVPIYLMPVGYFD